MNIWAFQGPTTADYDPQEYNEVSSFLTNSFRNGIARFGWSYGDNLDLHRLKSIPIAERDGDERKCWEKAGFLLDILPGDWIVQINQPYWGACLAGIVASPYSFEQEDNEVGDFRHMLGIDVSSIEEFERDDEEVLPDICSRLKLQGRMWRIYLEKDFLQTIENVRSAV